MKKCMAWYLVFAMFLIGIAPRVEAAFSPSEALGVSPLDRAVDVQKIQSVLENKLIQQRLQDLGFTSEEISARLSRMSDAQIHSFAQKLDDLKVGGDGFGIFIGLLVIAALVLVIWYLLGHPVSVK